ncbi:MAG: FAD-dependent oxidoreductase [Syntrophorhabdales bacterium]|jgi:2,4-dienoyl-CoA reductase (NADPH2)
MSSKRFDKLLEPSRIGSVKTRNRIIKPAAGLQYWIPGGYPLAEKAKWLFDAYARGGVGLIIMESPRIEKGGKGFRLDEDKSIQAMAEVTGIIHSHGCPVFVQLTSMANWNLAKSPDHDTRAPSPVCVFSEMDNHNTMPREMTTLEIEEVVERFAINAKGARKAGFDGVEINTSCTHLLHSFLSPFWNKRQDAYGGTLENRTRLLVAIIREIKKQVGQDFPVTALINGIEIGRFIGVEQGECLSLDESLQIARIIGNAGADAVQVRSHWIGRHDASFLIDHLCYPEPPVPLKTFPHELDMRLNGAGANVPMAGAFKKVVSIPVITVGRLDPELGEKILREGKADFIAMNRRLFADPEFPNKLAAGRFDDIAPCTSCTQCKDEDAPRRCRINAAIGTERPYVMEPAQKRKKVVVVGGGPAGMEAARVAALRGHEVVLFERSSRLGGLLPLAAMVKGLEVEDLPAITKYLKGQMTKLGVRIRLGKEATPALIEEMKPDVLILATGGVAALPEIPGIQGKNVKSNAELHRMLKFFLRFLGPTTLRKLTKVWMPLGKRVAIIGGGIQGCELAEFLVKRGREVTIVDSADALGEGMISHLKLQLFWWFRKKGVTMLPGVQPVAITAGGLTVLLKQGYKKTIEADSIIIALPMEPDKELLRAFEGKVAEIHAIGDCATAGLIVDAIGDGWRTSGSI